MRAASSLIARRALDEQVPVGEQRDQQTFDQRVLADDACGEFAA